MKIDDRYIADARERMRKKSQNEATCFALNDMLKDAQEEVRRLREENERLRVQLAGCGVAAMQNTADSRAHRITRDDYGWSASYADVCSAVDREISLREENERLRKDAAVGAAIQRAAKELPDGDMLEITVEKDSAMVVLYWGQGGFETMDVDDENRLAAEINAAIDAARGAK